MPSPEPALRNEVFKRWLPVYLLTIVLMALLIWDLVPQLRGYKDWPPEWRWNRFNGHNMWGLVPMALTGGLLLISGWVMDHGPQTRSRLLLWFSVILLASIVFQLGSFLTRTSELGMNIGPRTSVFYFEDFFDAAIKIDRPGEAFSNYEYIRENHNQLRIATHPPGLIYAYRVCLDISEWSQPLFEPFARWCEAFFRWDWIASQRFTPVQNMGLFLASLFKLLAGHLALAGIWLTLLAFPKGRAVTGRSLALSSMIPGMVIFALSLDAILAALSTLSIGFLLLSLAHDRYRVPLAIAAGLSGFLQSTLAFQVATTGLIGFIAAVIFAWHREPGIKKVAHRLWVPLLTAGITVLACWLIQYALTGYFFIEYLLEGITAHNKGPIHISRSRLAWLFFNQWDVFFFMGLAWLPLWKSRNTWRPFLANPLLYGFLIVWVLIHIGDGIRGETARLVLFAYPILMVALIIRNGELMNKRDYTALGTLLCAQTLVFAATLRVYFP